MFESDVLDAVDEFGEQPPEYRRGWFEVEGQRSEPIEGERLRRRGVCEYATTR